MATYRGDALPFLRDAVESVLGQTHARLELIVVLDGPVEEVAQRYLDACGKDDKRMRIVALPENVGPARARNRGIAEASGAFIAIMDADDLSRPERLAKQLAYVRDQNADLVGSFYRIIDAEGTVIGGKQVPVSPEAVRRWLYVFNPIANPTVFARADVLKAHPYPECGRSGTAAFDGEDYGLWVTLAREGCVLCNQPEPLVDFRTGPGFLNRRRGLGPFRTDLATKLRTLLLYGPLMKPVVVVVAVATAALRLLPTGLLGVLYRQRERLRFEKRGRTTN
jgi:Glycosyl transferase family 2